MRLAATAGQLRVTGPSVVQAREHPAPEGSEPRSPSACGLRPGLIERELGAGRLAQGRFGRSARAHRR